MTPPIPLGILASARHAAGGGALVGTFLQAAGDAANLTTYTFASQNLGAAAADRHILVAVACRSAGTITLSGVTVAGVSATIDQQITSAGTTVAIARAAVPTGATGDVVVTFSGGAVRAVVALVRLTGGTPTVSGANAGTTSATATTVANGYTLVTYAAGGLGSTSVTNITEEWNISVESNLDFEGGYTTTTGAATFTPASARPTVAVAYAG